MTSFGKLKFMSRHILTKSTGSGAETVKRNRLRRPFRRYLWADYQRMVGGSKRNTIGTRKMHAPKRRLRKSAEKVGLPECLCMPRNVGFYSWRLHTRRRQGSALQGMKHGTNPYSFKKFELPNAQRTFQSVRHVHAQLMLQSCMWMQAYERQRRDILQRARTQKQKLQRIDR